MNKNINNNSNNIDFRRKIRIIAFFVLIGVGIKKFLLPITAVVSIAIGAGGALILTSNNVTEIPLDTRSEIDLRGNRYLLNLGESLPTNVNNFNLTADNIYLITFNTAYTFTSVTSQTTFETLMTQATESILSNINNFLRNNEGIESFIPLIGAELNVNVDSDIISGTFFSIRQQLERLGIPVINQSNVTNDFFDLPTQERDLLVNLNGMGSNLLRQNVILEMYSCCLPQAYFQDLQARAVIVTNQDIAINRWLTPVSAVEKVDKERVPAIQYFDIHLPMNVDDLIDNAVLNILNDGFKVNLVDENNVSMKDLYSRGMLDILPLDTSDAIIRRQVGTFRFDVTITDKFYNSLYIKLFIHVLDITAPEIISGTHQTAYNNEKLSIDYILENVVIKDNYDGYICSSSALIIQDNYTNNYRIGGIHIITFSIADSSFNITIFNVYMEIIDAIPPIITGTRNISRDINTALNIQHIQSQLQAHDETDGNITYRIEVYNDMFTGNERRAGTFLVTFRVVDNAGNIAYHDVFITNMSDQIPEIVVIDGRLLIVERGTVVTREQLVALLIHSQAIPQADDVTVDSNWFGNENIENVFDMRVTIRDAEGNIVEVRYFDISVQENLFEDAPLPYYPEDDNASTIPWTWIIIGSIVLLVIVGTALSINNSNNKTTKKTTKNTKTNKK